MLSLLSHISHPSRAVKDHSGLNPWDPLLSRTCKPLEMLLFLSHLLLPDVMICTGGACWPPGPFVVPNPHAAVQDLFVGPFVPHFGHSFAQAMVVEVTIVVVLPSISMVVVLPIPVGPSSSESPHPCKDMDAMSPKAMAMTARKNFMATQSTKNCFESFLSWLVLPLSYLFLSTMATLSQMTTVKKRPLTLPGQAVALTADHLLLVIADM